MMKKSGMKKTGNSKWHRGTLPAQSAMEFMMTYGWAVLVMVGVISVLFYLGVMNPREQAPNLCTMPASFNCYGFKVSSNGTDYTGRLTLDLTQATGHTVNVTEIACDAREDPSFTTIGTRIYNGDHESMTVTCYKSSGASPDVGEYYKGDLHVRYLDENTGVTHRIVGSITYRVENDA